MTRPVRRALSFASGALACLLCASLPGHSEAADPPRTLAELIPTGAVATIEADDLRALLKRWSSSKLHKSFARSRAAKDMEKSRLYLRLAQNVEELEQVAGFGLSLERLTQVAGHRSLVALYDVPDTRFLLVTELTQEEARRSDLFGQKGRAAPREHRGIKYLLREGQHGKASLAVAQVGDRLIAGSDLAAFRGALVLAARAAGRPVAAAAGSTAEPTALTTDRDLATLLAAAPRSAPVRLWVDQKRVAGTHYFDDYWIFGKQSGADIGEALVAFAPGDDVTVETRIYLYAAGRRPDVIEDRSTEVGRADASAAVAALPPAPPFASAWPADPDRAAAAVVELLPRGAHDDEPIDPAPIAAALAGAKPRRALETIEPSHPKGGFAEHHGAIALGLAAPEGLEPKRLEAALAAAVAPRVTGAGSELSFADQGDVRALKLPLVAEWSLAWRRIEGGVVIATDPEACRRLATALAAPPAAKLLGAQAPRLYRLDLDRAAASWRDATHTLAARNNWGDPADADLYDRSIAGLFDVTKDTRRVVAIGYARGNQYIEEVQYRAR